MFRKLVVAAALLALVSSRVSALGLGEIDMQSVLNQPMQAAVILTSSSTTELADIRVSLASLQDHQRAGLTKAAVLASFRFEVVRDGTGAAVVRITSSEPVRDPYLEFLLELEWPKGRLLREYTVLVDPPVTMQAVPVAPQTPVTQAATPQPARESAAVPAAKVTPAPVTVPVAAATPDSYGPIRRSDTLWSIAEKLRPGEDVSMHQMMQALLRANPDAFINNNINHMKLGATLKVPGRQDILSMTAREAFAESQRQYREWKEARAAAVAVPTPAAEAPAPAEAEPAAAEAVEQEPATPEQAAAEEPQAPPAADEPESQAQQAESRLSLLAPEGESISGAAAPGDTPDTEVTQEQIADLSMQLTLASEEAAAGRAQSLELQSRVEELEQQIDTMKRLLELKDHALAELQASTANRAEQAAPAVAEDPAADSDAAAADRPAGIMGKLMDNPVLAGAGVLVALLLGFILWKAGRNRGSAAMFDDELTLDSRLSRAAGSGSEKAPAPLNVSEHSWETGEEELPHEGEHDVIAEADVYLAYGRIQQAEDVLQAALHADPHNDAAQLKLLEVYHAAGNVKAFERAASEYRDGVAAEDSRWQKVAEMGRTLAPANELFRTAADTGADFEMDLSGMEHMSETGADAATVPEEIEFTVEDVAFEDEEEQEGLLETDDEITTKLDLARAYIDMDDQDSARNILGEVIQEGNAEQKQEAEKIIARLA